MGIETRAKAFRDKMYIRKGGRQAIRCVSDPGSLRDGNERLKHQHGLSMGDRLRMTVNTNSQRKKLGNVLSTRYRLYAGTEVCVANGDSGNGPMTR